MWYEVLPVLGIIGVSVMVPQFLNAGVNKLVYGSYVRRNVESMFQMRMFLRDCRLTNEKFYADKGLDAI